MFTIIRSFLNTKRHMMRRYSILTILMIITVALFIPSIQWGVSRLENRYGNNIVVGLKIKELSEEDYKHITLPKWQQLFRTKLDIPLMLITVDYIYVPESAFNKGRICIETLTIQNLKPEERQIEVVLVKSTASYTVCLNPGINYLIQDSIESDIEIQAFILDSYTNPFWYPFDRRTLKFDLQLKAFYHEQPGVENKFTVNPAIETQTIPPTWFSRAFVSENPGGEEVRVVLSRPPLYAVLSVLMPIGILLILFLLIKYRQNIEGFWEVIVGLVFGLWGLSEVLIPNYIIFPTLISSILLVLFIPLGLFVAHDIWLYFLGEKPISHRNQQTTSDE